MEIIWHKNRYLHHIPQIHKNDFFAWNATEDGMMSKEAYFNKIEKSENTDHYKRVHISKSVSGKGNTSPKRYNMMLLVP